MRIGAPISLWGQFSEFDDIVFTYETLQVVFTLQPYPPFNNHMLWCNIKKLIQKDQQWGPL